MSRYLFVIPPFFGHVSPTLSVGATLLARGHEVAWFGITSLKPEHIPAGGSYHVPDLTEYEEDIALMLRRQDDGPSVSGPEVLKLALEETYLPIARFMRKGLLDFLDAWQPDVVVNDCITFAGALCARLKGIPCVTTTPVPPDVMGNAEETAPKIAEWQQNLIRGLQEEFGIQEESLHIHSHRLNMVFTSRAFAGLDPAPPHMEFVGPVRGRPNEVLFDWERLHQAKGPKIFVSLGTLLVDIRKAFFSKLVEAFADEPLTIIAATDPAALESWPENFIVQGFVPQAALMPHMDLVICHGGFNTVNDTFVNGLPMLITPIAYDHFHTAKLIERAGCGISIRYKRLRINDLRSAVYELLENPTYREAAVRIQTTFREAGGNDRAVELLETFAREPEYAS
ncbi:MAG: glycosyl transferase [Siphonobacter aquaeclarae]|nr:glycosyl transferase [Siphonobacter aquaeclarae]